MDKQGGRQTLPVWCRPSLVPNHTPVYCSTPLAAGRLASPGRPLYGFPMRFSQERIDGNSISAYASGQVTVNGEAITTSVIVTPKRIIHDWLPAVFEEMQAAHLERFARLDPEIILIGTGDTLRFPPAAWTAAYLARGIGVEVMDTAAACRTYNVLLSEDRRVVAALLIG